MGYYIQQRDSDFTILAKNKPQALNAIKELANNLGENSHYSWVNTESFRDAQTLKDAMRAWRWAAEENADGDIECVYFLGEKLGDEEILFSTLAPFVEADSYIEISGEENSLWRWVFDGLTLEEKFANISWE